MTYTALKTFRIKAFTLVEIVGVIAIAVIFYAAAVPIFGAIHAKTLSLQSTHQLQQYAVAVEFYHRLNGTLPTCLPDGTSELNDVAEPLVRELEKHKLYHFNPREVRTHHGKICLVDARGESKIVAVVCRQRYLMPADFPETVKAHIPERGLDKHVAFFILTENNKLHAKSW